MAQTPQPQLTRHKAAKAAKKKPGYFTAGPVLRAIQLFREQRGQQDSTLQLIELALRSFDDAAASSGTDFATFVNSAGKKHRVAVQAKSLSAAQTQAARLFIAHTHAGVDGLFKELCREVRFYRNISDSQWKKKRKPEDGALDPMSQLSINIPKLGAKLLSGAPEYVLLEYYRNVRNEFLHGDAYTGADLFVDESDVKAHRPYFKEVYKRGNAPNAPGDLCFDDFVLFTRAAKNFSELVNDACGITAQEIARKILLKDVRFVRRALLLAGRPEQEYHAMLRGYFNERFGWPEASHGDAFVDEVVRFIGKVPYRRQRRRTYQRKDAVLEQWLSAEGETLAE